MCNKPSWSIKDNSKCFVLSGHTVHKNSDSNGHTHTVHQTLCNTDGYKLSHKTIKVPNAKQSIYKSIISYEKNSKRDRTQSFVYFDTHQLGQLCTYHYSLTKCSRRSQHATADPNWPTEGCCTWLFHSEASRKEFVQQLASCIPETSKNVKTLRKIV